MEGWYKEGWGIIKIEWPFIFPLPPFFFEKGQGLDILFCEVLAKRLSFAQKYMEGISASVALSDAEEEFNKVIL